MIVVILGTRAELIKTFPLMLEFKKQKKEYIFIHTGQHSLGHLCGLFGVKNPDVVITPPPKKSSKFYSRMIKAGLWNLMIVPKIWNALRKIKNIKYVIYHGDTMSTASAAIASSRVLNWGKRYGNVHLESGLRSGSLLEPFPEEISRRICDKFSDVLLAVSDGTENNLRKEKQKGKIWNVGNTIIDAADWAFREGKKKGAWAPKGDFALMTIHRHENIKKKKRLSKLAEMLSRLPIKTVFPLHDNTKKKFIDHELWEKINSNKNLEIVELKGYVDFIYLLGKCKFLITDGGSIQEESLVFKKPCILLRKFTERDEGLDTGLNFLTDLNVGKAMRLVDVAVKDNFKVRNFKNPYGEVGVSKEIVRRLFS